MKNNTENNILINEFMGVHDKILSTGNIHSWSDAPFYYTTENTKEKVIENIARYAKYETSWDWLMGVVKKCRTITLNKTEFEEAIYYAVADLDEKKTYEAVVVFIKEYNRTK